MIYVRSLVLVLLCLSCKTTTKHAFETEVKKVFIDADPGDKFEKLLSYYRTKNFLKEKPIGWTMYPPLSALNLPETTNRYNFYFEKHPYLAQLGDGIIDLQQKSNNKETWTETVILFEYRSKGEAEEAYQKLIDRFANISYQKVSQYGDTKTCDLISDTSEPSHGIHITMGSMGLLSTDGYSISVSLIPKKLN